MVEAGKAAARFRVALGRGHPEVGAASVEDDGERLAWRANGDGAKVLGVKVVFERRHGNVTCAFTLFHGSILFVQIIPTSALSIGDRFGQGDAFIEKDQNLISKISKLT